MPPPDDGPLSLPARGLTAKEVACLYRVSASKVRNWLRTGKLGGIDTGENGKRRFIILPSHLAEFERQHSAAPPKPQRRRRQRRPSLIDQLLPD
jgi:hypothetical protein